MKKTFSFKVVSYLTLAALSSMVLFSSVALASGGGGGGGFIVTTPAKEADKESETVSKEDSGENKLDAIAEGIKNEPGNKIPVQEAVIDEDQTIKQNTVVYSENGKLYLATNTVVTSSSGKLVEKIPAPEAIVVDPVNLGLGSALNQEVLAAINVSVDESVSFSKPLRMVINVDKCPASGVRVLHVNEDSTKEWLKASCVNKKVVFATKSVSKFVVVSDPASPAVTFKDSSADWSYEYIETLRVQDVISGKTADTFEPNGLLTRAELTKIALNAFGYKVDESAVVSFTDVGADEWYAAHIAAAKKAGIVTGYGDGTFRPNDPVNRVEALKILLEASGLDLSTADKASFTDAQQEAWYAKYVNFASDRGVVSGYTSGPNKGKFGVSDNITRGAMAKIASIVMSL